VFCLQRVYPGDGRPAAAHHGAKNAFFCAISYRKRSIYQDRLGTTIAKS
jgi:hypothetical protein